MECPSEGTGLDGIVLVLEVTAEFGHPLEGQVGIAVGLEIADGLLRLPYGGHVTVGVTGTQESRQSGHPGARHRCRGAEGPRGR
jgi:hypothetical protein